jgi:hypothetical protein
MTDEAFHVRSLGGSWGVFTRAGKSVSEPMPTRADAVIHAKQLARRAGMAQVLIYSESGTLDSEFFYGRDERTALAGDDSVGSLAASRPEVASGKSQP